MYTDSFVLISESSYDSYTYHLPQFGENLIFFQEFVQQLSFL